MEKIDLMKSILWQYEAAKNMIKLAQNDQTHIDRVHTKFWGRWIVDVFNVPTCTTFGAMVWSFILDCPMRLAEGKKTRPGFGFGPNHRNFGRGNFSGQVEDFVDLLVLEEARQVLLLRWAQQTIYPSIGNAADIMNRVFGPGAVLLRDPWNMQVEYQFSAPVSRRMLATLRKYDLLPRPSGVELKIKVEA